MTVLPAGPKYGPEMFPPYSMANLAKPIRHALSGNPAKQVPTP